MNNDINDLLKGSMESIKNLVDGSIVVGNPVIYNNIEVLPISKVKFGFISAGSNKSNNPFIGGNAGTVSMTPVALVVKSNEDIKVMHLESNTHVIEYLSDNLASLIKEVLEKIKNKK